MKSNAGKLRVVCVLAIVIALFTQSCGRPQHTGAGTRVAVKDSALRLMQKISAGVTARGPAAWLDWFEDAPEFFMVNDGSVALNSGQSARKFIKDTLVSKIIKEQLTWSNIRVEAIAPSFASVAAEFHEQLSFSNGSTLPFNGYFTGIAHRTPSGWKIHNCHWSEKAK